jgi:hypothetical protein
MVHARLKKRKYLRLMRLSTHGIIRPKFYTKGLKVSKNADYTNLYMDFFEYTKANLRYFLLTSSFLIHLSGEGNFVRPFYLCETDAFFRVLYFVINRSLRESPALQKTRKLMLENLVSQHIREENIRLLSRFLYELNQKAYRLDLAAPRGLLFDSLKSFRELLANWNRIFFLKLQIKIELLLLAAGEEGAVVNISQAPEAQLEAVINLLVGGQCSCKLSLFIFNPALEEQEAEGPAPEQPAARRCGGCDWAGTIRFWLMSHLDFMFGGLEHFGVLYLQLALLILGWIFLLTLFVDMQNEFSLLLLLPYPFIQFVSVSLGFIWTMSNSYGIGKLFTVLNSLSLLAQLYGLCVALAFRTSTEYVVLKALSVIPFLLLMFSSRRMLFESRKLNKLYLN